VRLAPKVDATLFDRYPIVNSSKDCDALLGTEGGEAMLAEWRARIGTPTADEELARLNRLLAKHGKGPVALGASSTVGWESLADLPDKYLSRLRATDLPASVVWVKLEGRWGWRGRIAAYRLLFDQDRLSAVMLRSYRQGTYQSLPDRDQREDVDGYVDSP
jgi:hypothetical protein